MFDPRFLQARIIPVIKIIKQRYGVSARKKGARSMRAYESRSAGDKNFWHAVIAKAKTTVQTAITVTNFCTSVQEAGNGRGTVNASNSTTTNGNGRTVV